tara:strand:+ start:3145 stop:3291 length:147 start_codon:yes stop_codon:yes gene_type:complete
MDLPIDDEELKRLVWWTQHMMGEEELHKKLKIVHEARLTRKENGVCDI